MEVYAADGSRRNLHPGETAEVDQVLARFSDLRERLLDVQHRSVAASTHPSNNTAAHMEALHAELYAIFDQWLRSDSGADLVSFIMFLIKDLDEYRTMAGGRDDIRDLIRREVKHDGSATRDRL